MRPQEKAVLPIKPLGQSLGEFPSRTLANIIYIPIIVISLKGSENGLQVIMGYGGLQKLQAPAVEVGFSDGLDRGGTLEKAGQQCGAQLTQLRPCVKMSLTGRSCRA